MGKLENKKMIIIELQGGLGNQMFQYALASIVAKKNDASVLLDLSFFDQREKRLGHTPRNFELTVFNNSYTRASTSDFFFFTQLPVFNKVKRELGLTYPKIYNEPSFEFHMDILLSKTPIYIKGYFQSYRYFVGYEYFIRKLFSFPVDKLDVINKELLNTIQSLNTIAIHIRRGDYVSDKITAENHGSCSFGYYLESIKLLTSKKNDFTLVFFSDDSDWVEEQFRDLAYSKIFVHHNKEGNSWKDMLLMSSCSHNIIANSSFSWWAAWLNGNTCKTVIAPKKWFAENEKSINDLIPPEWTRL